MKVLVQQGLIMCYIQSIDWADFSKLPCPRQKVTKSDEKNAFQWKFWKMGRNSAIFGPIGLKFCMVLDQCLGEFQWKFRPNRPKNGRVMEVFVQQGLIMCYIQSFDWGDFSKLSCPCLQQNMLNPTNGGCRGACPPAIWKKQHHLLAKYRRPSACSAPLRSNFPKLRLRKPK